MSKNFYITTTLPYVNAEPHVGFAMELIRADVIARWRKLQGDTVFFNTGTDEHGSKLWQGAQNENRDVKEYVDTYAEKFKGLVTLLGISDDIHFVRTTNQQHELAAQEFWRRCDQAGYIYKKNYQTKYCVGCELEKTDSELNEVGECPLHPGRPLELIDEENYFFKFSAFQQPLLDFYKTHPNFVVPDFRFNEIKAFVERGLEDFSISRLKAKMPWGVEVPNDPDHVMYVWFDALVSYISTLGWPENEEQFDNFWKNGTPTQYCGKDNLRQQSAMWQAMLMAAGLPNSHQIIINGFYTGDKGIKMSKSIGNVINPGHVVAEYGVDALRYFVTRETSNFEDSPFTMERFKDAYNSGLANGLGNLFSRVKKMADTFSIVPIRVGYEEYKTVDHYLTPKEMQDFKDFKLQEVMNSIWSDIRKVDEFIAIHRPYETKSIHDVEYCLEQLKIISAKLRPFMPQTSETIFMHVTTKLQTPTTDAITLFPRKM